jgi:uncharacterized protein (DUF1800 family)
MNATASNERDSGNALTSVDPSWAWARYAPDVRWDRALASHLFRRAGFGCTWNQLETALERGPHAAIDELLQEPPAYARFASEFESHETAAAHTGDGMAFDAWWLRRLTESPWPLLEKVTLFWQGRFPLRSSAAGNLQQYHTHVRLLREKALGDFPSLLQALAGDVAMYTGLGGEHNRKAQPNVRFAKPWLAAFTVGSAESHPDNVANLARAWTGWFVYSGKLRFVEREHDTEPKSILGSQGKFGRDDAVRLLATHPATARNLAGALFRAFIAESADPPERLLAPLAGRLEAKATLAQVLEMILRSNLFFSEHAVRQRIKSPVELVVGLVRSLEGVMPAAAVANELANLGQRLDDPPTVHGWAGGKHWLNTITMAARLRLCDSLVCGSEGLGQGLDPAKVVSTAVAPTVAGQERLLVDLLLGGSLTRTAQGRLKKPAATSPEPLKAIARDIVAQPEFQLS